MGQNSLHFGYVPLLANQYDMATFAAMPWRFVVMP